MCLDVEPLAFEVVLQPAAGGLEGLTDRHARVPMSHVDLVALAEAGDPAAARPGAAAGLDVMPHHHVTAGDEELDAHAHAIAAAVMTTNELDPDAGARHPRAQAFELGQTLPDVGFELGGRVKASEGDNGGKPHESSLLSVSTLPG